MLFFFGEARLILQTRLLKRLRPRPGAAGSKPLAGHVTQDRHRVADLTRVLKSTPIKALLTRS